MHFFLLSVNQKRLVIAEFLAACFLELIQQLINGEAALFLAADIIDDSSFIHHADTHQMPGAVVFKLYDTYGFPKELTQEIAQDAGYTVDMAGFDVEMEAQKQRARNARGNEQSMRQMSSFWKVCLFWRMKGYAICSISRSLWIPLQISASSAVCFAMSRKEAARLTLW